MSRSRKQEPIGDEYAEFGAKIKLLRHARGLTQEQLSELIGISKTSVVNYETGTRKVPLSMVKRFSEFYHVSIDELVGIEAKGVPNAGQLSRWREEIGEEHFSDEEFEELIAYAKYMIHRRNDK